MMYPRLTLNEFITKLQQYPSDATIRIEDADTNWYINNIHINYNQEEKIVTLDGLYSEME